MTKSSTIRSKGISIFNCKGNQTMYSSTRPFLFGAKNRPAELGTNGKYCIIKTGQFAGLTDQPFNIELC